MWGVEIREAPGPRSRVVIGGWQASRSRVRFRASLQCRFGGGWDGVPYFFLPRPIHRIRSTQWARTVADTEKCGPCDANRAR